MNDRDPRIDPRIGDEILQRNTGIHLRVTDVDSGYVAWDRKMKHGWTNDNSWTLLGWQRVVAHEAKVIRASPNTSLKPPSVQEPNNG